MKHTLKALFLFIGMACLLSACQSIDDTYDHGDGEIRYIGKCSNLTVTEGWKRLIVNWDNNIDPIIDKVKVKWSADDMADSVFLERGTTEYNITNLENTTYKIEVCSVDKDGNPSISTSIYGRPYTEQHEEINSFTRIIAKQYFIGDHIVMLFSDWQDEIKSAILKYTKKDGSQGEFELTKDIVGSKLYELPDAIDFNHDITLYRTGTLSNCPDLIEFNPYILSKNKTYTADFKDFIKSKYGEGSKEMDVNGNIPDSWSNSTESIELDADFNSFEDLLNLPKLKTLRLGKNRYQTEAGAADATRGQYKLYDADLSTKVLNLLHKYNGLTVERYNKHYAALTSLPYMKEMGMSKLPNYSYIDMSKAKITMAPKDDDDYNSHINYLIDGNVNSCWAPLSTTSMVTYQITIDLQQEVEATGIKLVQKTFDEYSQDNDIAPTTIQAEYAGRDAAFHNATHLETNYIGNSSGETIFLPFTGGKKNVRYIRLSVPSQFYHNFYQVTLAEVGLYK